MGWTGIDTKKTFMEVFEKEYESWKIPGSEHHILKSIEIGVPRRSQDEGVDNESEIFSAISYSGCVYAHTLMIIRRGDEVVFKGQHEMVGPYCKNKCPKEIMDLLTPLDNMKDAGDYWKVWRARQ